MDYKQVMHTAASTFNQRGTQYGPMDELFQRAAQVASIVLSREYTPYEIVMIMRAVKDCRLKYNMSNPENYVDNINYTGFAAQFATDHLAAQEPEEDDGAAAMGAKFGADSRTEGY